MSNERARFGSAKFCDSCLEAASDEGAEYGIEDIDSLETILVDLGADIADHICDSPGHCLCACRMAA